MTRRHAAMRSRGSNFTAALLILFGSWILLATSAGAESPEVHRPNVLVIMPDQLRGQALGCMGNPDVQTPHLDRLASQGLLFRNTFANTPVCCPARAIMLTGTYAHTNGMIANDLRLRESETTIAEILARRRLPHRLRRQVAPRRRQATPRLRPARPSTAGLRVLGRQRVQPHPLPPDLLPRLRRPDHREPVRARGLDRPGDRVPQARPATIRSSSSSRWGRRTTPTAPPEQFMKLYDPAKLTMRPNWVEGTPGAGRKEIAAYYAAIDRRRRAGRPTAEGPRRSRPRPTTRSSSSRPTTATCSARRDGGSSASPGRSRSACPGSFDTRPGSSRAERRRPVHPRRPGADAPGALRPAGPGRDAGNGPVGVW